MILYGKHTVTHALNNPARVIRKVWMSRPHDVGMRAQSEWGIPVEKVKPAELDRLAKSTNHQGIAADVDPLPLGNIEEVKDRVLMLDQITDPQNFGAIVRSAATFGYYDIITHSYQGLIESPVVARVASGAMEYVRIIPVTNLSQTMEALKKQGFWCYGLHEEGEHVLSAQQLSGRIVLVLGSEGSGMRRLVRETCDVLMRIPSAHDFCVLNASQAASIAMYATLNSGSIPPRMKPVREKKSHKK